MTYDTTGPDLSDDERTDGKRDRTARLLNVLGILQGSGDDGIRVEEIARRTNMSRRSAYRDLRALERELRIPLWSDGGRWGVGKGAFLPPLQLTQHEATAVFLAARVITRYSDKYDPNLASAFQKLAAALPDALREHVERTLRDLALRPMDLAFNRHVEDLTRAWAQRRVVRFRYAPAAYDGGDREPSWREVRPYLVEPSLQTHALYLIGLDETKAAMRTFKVERILDLSLTARTFEAPGAAVSESLRRAWDIIADQPEVQVVLRFVPSVSARVREATWHPSQSVTEGADGSLEWRARVSGTVEIRLWILAWGDDVEVLEPVELRAEVAATHARAVARYPTA
jgi:predicted DNA-binding transcriptional regulator YafY